MKHRVMIVDDDHNVLESFIDGLQEHFEVIGASNGMEGLEKLDLYEPDLIVLDIMMPGVDGLGACRAIRKNARFSDIPIIFLSGQDVPEIHSAMQEHDIVYFLRKPITPGQLKSNLCEYLAENDVLPRPKTRSIENLMEQEERDAPIDRLKNRFQQKEPVSLTPTLSESQSRPNVTPTEVVSADNNGRHPRIIILDDDESIVNYVIEILHQEYEVIGLNNPVTAIDRMQRFQPDVVILDVIMPGLSGYQVSQLIRIKPELKDTKIVFTTSCDSREDVEYAQRLGAAGFLSKPFTPAQLKRKLTELLEKPDFQIRPKLLSLPQIKELEADVLI